MSFGAVGKMWRVIWGWSCTEDLALHCWCGALFTPFIALMVQSADQRPIHHSPIWPPSLFSPHSPFLVLLFLLFSLHLFIKLMRLKLGPSSQEGVTERNGGHKQAGKESLSLLCIPEHCYMSLVVCLCLKITHTHTHCDKASEECDIRTCECLYVTQSFSQAPVLCNSTQVSFRKWPFISPLCCTICLCLLHRHDTPDPPALVLSIWL